MRLLKTLVPVVVLSALIALVSACKDPVKTEVATVALDKQTLSLEEGQTATLKATVTPKDSKEVLTWKSSDTKVATVSNGTVKAVKEGTAKITVSLKNGNKADCTVTVKAKAKPQPKPEPPKTTITLDKTEVSVEVGLNVVLKATLTPADAKDATITWTSSNDKVATVKDGTVTGVAAGTATITASLKNGNKAECTVTVTEAPKPQPVKTTITLDKTEASVEAGQTVVLKATLTPADAKDAITWASSDDNVATVSDGTVTGVAAGTATITASLENGNKAECTVTVTAPAPKAKFRFTKNPIEVDLNTKVDLMQYVELGTPLGTDENGNKAEIVFAFKLKKDIETGDELPTGSFKGSIFDAGNLGERTITATRTDTKDVITTQLIVKNKEFSVPEGARIVISCNGKTNVKAIKVPTDLSFTLEGKVLDKDGNEVAGVEIVWTFTGALSQDPTNNAKFTTVDEQDVNECTVTASVAGTSLKKVIKVTHSYGFKKIEIETE